ncbi:MAG: RebB family R body protein [Magnetospirillum sp. WYHS-4]
MADDTPVNGQITDAVTQANVKVLGDAPAMAMGAIFQALAHSTGILYENAVGAQQQLGIAAQAATNQGVIQIYSVDTMAGAAATSKIASSDVPNNMLSLLSSLKAVSSKPVT